MGPRFCGFVLKPSSQAITTSSDALDWLVYRVRRRRADDSRLENCATPSANNKIAIKLRGVWGKIKRFSKPSRFMSFRKKTHHQTSQGLTLTGCFPEVSGFCFWRQMFVIAGLTRNP